MKRALIAALLLLGAGWNVQAASFDCAKARTAVEKEICANPALSRLDEQLAAAYRAALVRTPAPGEIALHQRWWLRERDHGLEGAVPAGPYSGERLVEHYAKRLAELNDIRARDATSAAPFSRDRLGKSCAPMAKRPCRVSGSGALRGGADAPALVYQVEQMTGDDVWETGAVVFEPAAPGRLRPIVWAYGYGEHGAPRLVRSPAGWLVLVPWQDEESRGETPFRSVDGRWRDIDTEALTDDLQKRVGEGRWADDAVYDWTRFTATAPLRWSSGREGSAGTARFTYGLEGDRLVIRTFSLTPAR